MIDSFFPTLIYRNNLGPLANNEALYKKALEVRKMKNPVVIWDSGVYNSLASIDIRDDPLVRDLITMCKLCVHQYMTEIKGINYKDIECTDCWFNVYEKGDYQEIHAHIESHISAVYYVRVPPKSGDIIFTNPTHLTAAMPIEDNGSARYTPGNSDILVFKSNLAHRVSRSQSDELRVSVALNFLLIK